MEKKDASKEVEIKDPVIKKLIKKGIIAEDEKVLYTARQKRWYRLIWPGQIIITDVQVIFYTITWFGYNLDAYGYDFFHNISVKKWLFSSKICFITRLGVAKMRGLPHDAASEAMQAIGRGIRARIALQEEPLQKVAEVS
ncbi:MAG: PH domain-containing protein [Methanosarcinales archaeon]|nr:PH domain-containing protein [Methanosarcinales archaeon]